MTGLGFDDAERWVTGKMPNQLLLLCERVEPVRDDAGHACLSLHSPQGLTDSAPTPADVVMIHRLAECHVGVRVEPMGELLSLVLQIRLDRVAPAFERLLLTLGLPIEAPSEFVTRPKAELPHASCN